MTCAALESTCEPPLTIASERLFQKRGRPSAIRSDEDLPFGSPNGRHNLSKCPVWCLRLDIAIESIKPDQPHPNGSHEHVQNI